MHPARCTLLAEALPSKQVDQLADVQHIDATLKALSDRWRGQWLEEPGRLEGEPLRITAVLARPCHAFDFAVALHLALWPLRFKLVASSANRAGANKQLQSSKFDFQIHMDGLNEVDELLIQSTAQLHAVIMKEWKPSRAKAAQAMCQCQNQFEAAELLGIRQQSVSEALRAGHAKELDTCETAIRARLNALGGS
ncbi:MAG: hypothetical protein GY747_08050 [Planctomycetes bacterium]|nr:hypothetical protein [Planctomycetota bacterium]MCP4771134.1 hypothetical protein [Planctomycetota bacterium]MCP4862139.1 hypothetical protein [Planctomycetota bacterium]